MHRARALALVLFGALLLSACLPAWAEAPAAQVSVPKSIDATGRTDVSAAFAKFLASVPDDSTVSFAPGGTYRMESTLQINGRHRLTFQGNGATIFATTQADRNRANIRIKGGTSIVFRDLTVRGANPKGGKNGPDPWVNTYEAQHNFDALGVKGFALLNVTGTDPHGDFVHLGPSNGVWTDDVLVRDSRFERSGRQGISFFAVRNVTIENSSFSDMRRATFNLEPGNNKALGVDNVVIRNNRVGPGRLFFVSSAGYGPVNNVTIEGNVLSGQALQVYVRDTRPEGRRSNWKVLDNTSDLRFSAPHKSVMRIYKVDNLVIRGNHQPFKAGAGMVGAAITNSCKVTAAPNSYPNAVGQATFSGRAC